MNGADGSRRYVALVMATLALLVNFWAWGLLSPLGPTYQELLKLGPSAVSVLVAIPVVIGSLGRIPLGALTDRYGGRIVFSFATLACVIPVVWLAILDSTGATGYAALIAGAALLGIGGATFAIGVPFVNAWFPPHQRGLALGIFGVGNAGTAISGFVTPWLSRSFGRATPFWVVAIALVVMGVGFFLIARDVPDRPVSDTPFLQRFRAALGLRATKELSFLYAITFGGFVAFGVYLPLYLKAAYGLTTADAALRAAGFTVLATLARPVGGWLSDRIDAVAVLRVVFGVIAAGAIAVSFTLPMVPATMVFLTMAAALGIGNGAIFALVSQRVPVQMVGSATGVVGAAGGLGGFLPPIVMGVIFGLTHSYSIGYMLLSDVALAALVYCVFVISPREASLSGPMAGARA